MLLLYHNVSVLGSLQFLNDEMMFRIVSLIPGSALRVKNSKERRRSDSHKLPLYCEWCNVSRTHWITLGCCQHSYTFSSSQFCISSSPRANKLFLDEMSIFWPREPPFAAWPYQNTFYQSPLPLFCISSPESAFSSFSSPICTSLSVCSWLWLCPSSQDDKLVFSPPPSFLSSSFHIYPRTWK